MKTHIALIVALTVSAASLAQDEIRPPTIAVPSSPEFEATRLCVLASHDGELDDSSTVVETLQRRADVYCEREGKGVMADIGVAPLSLLAQRRLTGNFDECLVRGRQNSSVYYVYHPILGEAVSLDANNLSDFNVFTSIKCSGKAFRDAYLKRRNPQPM